jgi:23S rRNA-/tRNA-specific pseudouridylate synthase
VVDPERGKPATTDFNVIERFPQAALLEARPHTGYTHQIRAHLRALGCPILADTLYGSPTEAPNVIARLGLHARQLTFTHPLSGEPLVFTAPVPVDFMAAVDQLRKDPGMAKYFISV